MPPQENELITPEEARRITGVLSETDMYRKIRFGEFPKPVRLSRGANRFVRSECYAYVQKLIAERDAREAQKPKHEPTA